MAGRDDVASIKVSWHGGRYATGQGFGLVIFAAVVLGLVGFFSRRPEVSEFDKLVAIDGVLMAGRFGPDGSVAEYKANPWFVKNPVTAEMAHWFCTAITTMLSSMAYAIDVVNRNSFGLPGWLPMKSWAYTGGDYMIAVRGDRFIIAERAKLGSLDELDRLVGSGQP